MKIFTEIYAGTAVYFKPKLIAILLLGIVSGLPLMLTLSTLSAWLAESGVDLTTIGLFAAVTTPYALKFLWAPLIDRVPLPGITTRFGRRRGWMYVVQAMLVCAVVGLGMSNPADAPFITALWALAVSTCSATQDIVIDAYRVEILEERDLGAGAAVIQLGYRMGMLLSGAGALFLATDYGWQTTYLTMAAILILGSVVVSLTGEPDVSYTPFRAEAGTRWLRRAGLWLKDTVIAPFTNFMQRKGWLAILLFMVFYKFGDAFATSLSTPFLLDIGFSKNEIATISKSFGLIAVIVGTMIGGGMVNRLGIMKSLWVFGFLQMGTILLFVWQARVGHDPQVLAIVIAGENLAAGMGAAAFVAYLSKLCSVEYTATQYALFSSLAAAGRTWLSTPSGWAAENLGWETFFMLSTLLAIPGLLLLLYIQKWANEDDKAS